MADSAPITAENGVALDALLGSMERSAVDTRGPKYRRIVVAFSECIRTGLFRPGQRVPSETALADRLTLSVGTVRKALEDLAASGVIERYRKNGTFIADRRAQVSEVFVYRFRDPRTGETQLPFVRTYRVAIDTKDGPWRDFLGAESLVRLDRLVWFEGEPPAQSSVYLHPDYGGVFLETEADRLHGASIHRMLIDRFNLPSLRLRHAVSCGAFPVEVCQRLTLPTGAFGTVWDIRDSTICDEPMVFQRYHLPQGHRPIEIEETFGAQARHAGSQRRATRMTTTEQQGA
ncbi:MAG: GntR family transcriptional regulator [Pseudomonadota bacterium]